MASFTYWPDGNRIQKSDNTFNVRVVEKDKSINQSVHQNFTILLMRAQEVFSFIYHISKLIKNFIAVLDPIPLSTCLQQTIGSPQN